MERLRQLARPLTDIGLTGLVDIAIVTLVIYVFLVVVKRTRRSGLILTGIVIVGAIYFTARNLNMVLTVALLQGFFAFIIVSLVVIFQEDLRYFFERVGLWWMERRLPLYQRRSRRLPRREVETLARTLADLARARIGALVVIRGRDTIGRHLTGGEEVQGRLSEPLLKSIFDPHSIGHDGAVIIEGDLLDRMGCQLPLSTNLDKLPRSGTRHAAALGLSERSDALCLVVSEERGTISAARGGDIWRLADPAELAKLLDAYYDDVAPQREARPVLAFFRRNYREKAVALGLSVALWLVVVYRSAVVQKTFDIPVQHGLLSTNLIVKQVDPETVRVTFSAERKKFEFLGSNEIKLVLQLWDIPEGPRELPITSRELTYPSGLELDSIEPRRVSLLIEEKPPGTNSVRP